MKDNSIEEPQIHQLKYIYFICCIFKTELNVCIYIINFNKIIQLMSSPQRETDIKSPELEEGEIIDELSIEDNNVK